MNKSEKNCFDHAASWAYNFYTPPPQQHLLFLNRNVQYNKANFKVGSYQKDGGQNIIVQISRNLDLICNK